MSTAIIGHILSVTYHARMHNLDLILTLTSGLGAALILGYLTHRLGLSPIVGYLLAGIAVGPHTPGLVANDQLAQQLAEVGVILLEGGTHAISGTQPFGLIAYGLGSFTSYATPAGLNLEPITILY